MGIQWIRRISIIALLALVSSLPVTEDLHSNAARISKIDLIKGSYDVSTLPQTVQLSDITHLQKVLKEYDFCLSKASGEDQIVPRLYFANFPSDFKKEKDLNQKKEIFLHVLLPMILRINEEIMQERQELLTLKQCIDKGNELNDHKKSRLNFLCEKYKMNKADFDELLRRVDIIPPSLALGQAIIESGWGSSYAALKKNSLFGMTISQEVKTYQTLYDSVSGYVRNLNSNNAYRTMRKTREKLQKKGMDVDGYTLIGDMIAYSEEKKRYIGKVRNAISVHDLIKYDSFSLVPAA